MKKIVIIRIAVALLLILAGIVGLIIIHNASSLDIITEPALSQINSSQGTEPDQGAVPIFSGIPTRIEIPSVGINLKVVPGYYNPKTRLWTISLNDAQFATMTQPANNKGGLTFIYGHYRPGVFMNLHNIAAGATAQLKTDNGHAFVYKFRQNLTTVPKDTSFLSYQGKPILVVQTCSGSFYQNRQLFVFDFSKVVA